MKRYNIQDILYKLVKLLDQLDNIKQYASQNEIEPFTRNALEFAYFMSKFHESIEKKTDDPGYRLTLPLKYTRWDQHELFKRCDQCHYQTL